ncbi:hypothetical protein NPIL_128391 [Nephila pilipes]|uniref:Uncharacterized protein n=1 Tax=Nephila pilipes TaxID=299642 RepID=A0A8X6TPJ4_NEPPI|nr:hypothetical protein NPIL_128391 [Nephila pilipes]
MRVQRIGGGDGDNGYVVEIRLRRWGDGDNYNHAYHSSIKRAPTEVILDNENDVWLTLYGDMESVKRKACVFEWDISFGIPLDELKEILNATEMVDEFADDSPRWDDNVSGTQQCIEVHEQNACAPSTNKQAVPVLKLAKI